MEFAEKRKVDQENRQFKTDWTEKYCFFLPDHANAKPTCLICIQNVAVIKSDNLKRHFTSIHAASFNANYPEKPDQRTQKIAGLLASYKHSVSTMSKTTSAQESATAASLHVSWTLARAKKPFADAELIKRCAIEMAREVLNPDEKQQKKVVELLKQVPLSANTATRRVEVLAEECFFSLHTDLKKTEAISLAIDSSCDRTEDIPGRASVFAYSARAHDRGNNLPRADTVLRKNGLNVSQILDSASGLPQQNTAQTSDRLHHPAALTSLTDW